MLSVADTEKCHHIYSIFELLIVIISSLMEFFYRFLKIFFDERIMQFICNNTVECVKLKGFHFTKIALLTDSILISPE